MTGPLGLDLRDGANGQSAGCLLREPLRSPRCQEAERVTDPDGILGDAHLSASPKQV